MSITKNKIDDGKRSIRMTAPIAKGIGKIFPYLVLIGVRNQLKSYTEISHIVAQMLKPMDAIVDQTSVGTEQAALKTKTVIA